MLPRLFRSLLCTLACFAVAASLPAQAASPLRLNSNNNPALAYSSITFIAGLDIPFPGGAFSFTIGTGLPMAPTGGGRNPDFASYTTNTLAQGVYVVTATFTPSDGSTPYTATLTQVVTAAIGDFTLTAYPPALSIRDGGIATGLIAATSINDFHGPIALSCSVPQRLQYTCTLTPTSVQLLLNDYETSTLTLTSNVPIALGPRPRGPIRPPNGSRSRLATRSLLASLLPLSLLSFAFFPGCDRRSRLRSLVSLLVLALIGASTTACGPNIFSAATPPGAYPITITATGNTPGEPPITHTLNLTLNLTD